MGVDRRTRQVLADPQLHNSYTYARNNPIIATDPNGEFFDVVLDVGFTLFSAYRLGEAIITGGDVKGEAANLALDAGGLFIPGAAGLGTIKRTANTIDGAADAGRTVNRLPDSTVVCRGGACSAKNFAKPGEVKNGVLSGSSVNASPNASVEELTKSFPHKQYGQTTAGKIRELGGEVVPTASKYGNNPYHADLSGITPQQAESLFTPTKQNPNKLK